jgi:hypothetical protein
MEPTMIRGGVAMTDPDVNQHHVSDPSRGNATDEELQQIRDSLRGLLFGSVNIIVQDGVVIQIDRTEKRRLRGNRNNQ